MASENVSGPRFSRVFRSFPEGFHQKVAGAQPRAAGFPPGSGVRFDKEAQMHRSPPDGRLSRRRLGLGHLARPRTLGMLGVLACAGAAMLPTGAAVDRTSTATAAPANTATGPGNGFVVTSGDLTYILK